MDTMLRGRCRIADRRYELELSKLSWLPLDTQREQIDQGAEPGEQSLTDQSLWRRQFRTWRYGAGQEYFDEPDEDESDRRRFYTSKGVHCWDRRKLKLQPTMARIEASTIFENLFLAVATDSSSVQWAYRVVGANLYYSSNGTTWSGPVTGLNGQTIRGLATDGYYVYTAGSLGIDRVAPGAAAGAAYSTQACTCIGVANGRLLVGNTNRIYEITNAGATSTLVYTHWSDIFEYTSIIEAPNATYFAGNTYGKGEIFKAVTESDGTLGPLVFAGGVDTGELVYTLAFYSGAVVVGTSKGLRLMAIDNDGFLTRGPVIDDPASAVRCVDVYGDSAWFGWTNFDGTSTGLGRATLNRFTQALVPAFASDLMVTAQGAVFATVLHNGRRILSIMGNGFFRETTVLEPEGTWDSGLIGYGVPYDKAFLGVDMKLAANPTGASVELSIEEEDGTVTPIMTLAGGELHKKGMSTVVAEQARLLLTLNRATDTALGPEVERLLLTSTPRPGVRDEILLPVILHSEVEVDDVTEAVESHPEWIYLKGLEQQAVTFEVGASTYRGIVAGVGIIQGDVKRWNDADDDELWFEMYVTVRMTTVELL